MLFVFGVRCDASCVGSHLDEAVISEPLSAPCLAPPLLKRGLTTPRASPAQGTPNVTARLRYSTTLFIR